MNKTLLTIICFLLSANVFANEVTDLYANSKAWSEFISKVENGDKTSIIKAIKLRKISDAGASSELNDALFAALKYQPMLILSSYKQACNGRTDPLKTYEEAIKEVDEIITIVAKLNSNSATECVNKLTKSKSDIARFFGVNANSL